MSKLVIDADRTLASQLLARESAHPESSSRPDAPFREDRGDTRSIGAILIDEGRITVADAERILRLQKEEKLRFGDAAVRLGILSESDIRSVLARQFNYSYFALDSDAVSTELVAAYQPYSRRAEQLRALRSQLMLRWLKRDGRGEGCALAIAGTGRGEGRS